jgi:hypothetical protein
MTSPPYSTNLARDSSKRRSRHLQPYLVPQSQLQPILFADMSDDWQDAAFSSRHMHNNRGGKSKRSNFDVRKTFGSYELKCPAFLKLEDVSPEQNSSLELYRLTENGEGVIGEVALPGALNAAMVLAASRESLRRTVEDLEEDENDEDDKEDDDEEDENDSAPTSPSQSRFETFEKNSFRSPKFWLKWSGAPISRTPTTPSSPKASRKVKENADVQTGLGYIVFSGNDCRKFKGTINCEAFGWKDVAITGHKIAARSESDVPVAWGKAGMAM